MREHWTYPSSPQSANSPPINPPPLNTTCPLPTASSTMLHLTPTPTKPFTPLPWLSGPAPTPVSCPDLSRAVWLAARLGLETPHPTFLTPPESHRQSWKDKQSLVRASRLLQSHPSDITPPPVTHNAPSPCLLPAHTRGGSVCSGRGGVCCRFWQGASVGRAHAHPNQPWPPPTVTPSPIR